MSEVRCPKLMARQQRKIILAMTLSALAAVLLVAAGGRAKPEPRTAEPLTPNPEPQASAGPQARAFWSASPTITIAGASATTTTSSTAAAHEADIEWQFGTVSGTYSSCTVQAKTSFDGVNFLTLGSAASVTATSNTINYWRIVEQAGTTSVTTTTPSSTAAAGFGRVTEFTFACSSYGTSAPVTISVIYR